MANYLYNGVELPELPEWDKEKYPYAVILYSGTNDKYILRAYSEPVYVNKFAEHHQLILPSSGMTTLWCEYVPTESDWRTVNVIEEAGSIMQAITPSDGDYVLWTNTNLYWGRDYTISDYLYLAASAPIRVDSKLSISVGQMMRYGTYFTAPDITPFWDKTKYPYACVVMGLGFHYAYFHASEIRVEPDGNLRKPYFTEKTTMQYFYKWDNEEQWGSVRDGETFTEPAAGHVEWSNTNVYNTDGSLYLAASDPVPCLAATFDCSNLNETDSVYKISAWCYPKGESYQTAPFTYTSAATFPGTEHSERWALTDLPGGVEYDLYAVIVANGKTTDHNALATFTTEADEGETPTLLLTANQITGEGFNLYLLTKNLEAGTLYTAEVIVYKPDSSAVVFEDELTIEGSGIDWITVTGLEPNTEYAVSVDIYPSPSGEVILHGDYTVTTGAEVPVVRDSFPLGFASGLSGMPITETDADYNTWAQGYIVGCALRKAL